MDHLLRDSSPRELYAGLDDDASWLDYLRLPHSLSLATLAKIANHYRQGALVEEVGLTFLNERWREAPVIEALFQGTLEAVGTPPQSGWLPGFA
jgi:hypothetical protein